MKVLRNDLEFGLVTTAAGCYQGKRTVDRLIPPGQSFRIGSRQEVHWISPDLVGGEYGWHVGAEIFPDFGRADVIGHCVGTTADAMYAASGQVQTLA